MSAHDEDRITPRDNAPFEALVPTFTADGHLDDGTIEAWLDSAFDDEQMTVVAVHVEACASCGVRVAEARGFMAGASRVVHALDVVPAGVVPAADVARTASRIVAAAAVADATRTTGVSVRARRAWYTQPVMRAAAALLVMVAGGTYVWSRTSASLPATMPRMSAAVASDSAAPVAKRLTGTGTGAAADADLVSMEAAKVRATASVPASVPTSVPASAQVNAQVNAQAPTGASAKPDTPSVSAQVAERAPLSAPPVQNAVPSSPPSALRDRPTTDVAMGKVTADANFVGKAAGASVSSERRETVQRAMAPGAAERSERADAAAIGCWMVSATDAGPGVVLPTQIAAAVFAISSRTAATWSNWPTRGQVTPGEFTLDSLGVLRGAASRDDLQLTLSLTARDASWVGTATQRRSSAATTRGVVLTRANPSMCKP